MNNNLEQGYRDGFLDLPPSWLGIDEYKHGYSYGLHERKSVAELGAVLLRSSEDGMERLYLYKGVEIFVRRNTHAYGGYQWSGVIPGYGTSDHLAGLLIHLAYRGKDCSEPNWFTKRGPQFYHKLLPSAQV